MNMETQLISEKKAEKAWERREVDVERTGTKIVLPNDPAPMPLKTAIAALQRKLKDEETINSVHEVIDAYPEDALVALNAAMKQKYGWASAIPTPGFFGPIPPQIITVKTGPKAKDSVQVPFGRFTLPGVENPIQTHRMPGTTGMVLVLTGEVKKREVAVVKELAELAREYLRDHSIYKAQAIRLKVDEYGNINQNEPPEFIDTDKTNPNELILNPDEFDQITASLWTPIRFTSQCVEHSIPLNRGILLEGTYGTGKTLAAAVTSKVCVDNGWTYILLDDVRALRDALLFAQRYAPAVVFAEDVDQVVSTRDQRGNDLLNIIDGVLTKNSQVITVLTTNHVERLDKAMLRPGRLDAVISIQTPGPEAVGKLIHLYGRDMIKKDEDLGPVGEELAGNIPATIREVVERSKLAMIAHDRNEVTAEDLSIAGRGMRRHLELLKDAPVSPSVEEQVGQSIGKLIGKNAKDGATEALIENDEDSVKRKVDRLVERMGC